MRDERKKRGRETGNSRQIKASADRVSRSGEVEKRLEAIYKVSGGRMPDLSRLTRRRSNFWTRFLVGFVVFCLMATGIAWAGFFFGQPFLRPNQSVQAMAVSIEARPSVMLGREETIRVLWSNETLQPISAADLRLSWPAEFTPSGFDPAPTDPKTKRWSLGFLAPGARGSITIRGVFTGALGGSGVIQSLTTYQVSPTARERQMVATQSIVYGESVLDGKLALPSKVLSGDAITARYTVRNTGALPLREIFVRWTLPKGFSTNGATSTISGTEMVVPIGELRSQATSTFELTGTFISGMSGDAAFQAEAGRRGVDGTFIPLQQSATSVAVITGDLSLQLIANGSNEDRSLEPGSPIRLAIGYQNTSPEPLKQVVFILGVESIFNGKSTTGTSVIHWPSVYDVADGTTSTRSRIQTVRFDTKNKSELATLLPQADNVFEFSLPTIAAASGTKDVVIRFTLEGQIGMVGNTKVDRIVRTRPLAIRYRSDVKLTSEARYYTEEGAPFGFGPLPPIAGKTTAYRVVWRVHKTLHALDDMTVKATLPSIAAWSARTSAEAGTVQYDPTSRTVTWKLNHMPESVGDLEASFEVQLTPLAVDVGRFAALLGETSFEATDVLIKEVIAQKQAPLSSDLQTDESARGKGVVRKE